MKVGLIDVDSKIANLALMKIAAWHKMQGDEVEWYNIFGDYDMLVSMMADCMVKDENFLKIVKMATITAFVVRRKRGKDE